MISFDPFVNKSKMDANATNKFKTHANETQIEGVSKSSGPEWKPPLRRHINPNSNQLEFVTILVRVLSGDAGNVLSDHRA